MRVLVVEDDALLGDAIQTGLRQAGFAVDWAHDGVAADHALAAETYAAVVLDLGLPRLSGLEVLRRLRARESATPVLILTAHDAVSDRIAGLDAGADDYVLKPFDMGELAARLRALGRRAGAQPRPCSGSASFRSIPPRAKFGFATVPSSSLPRNSRCSKF